MSIPCSRAAAVIFARRSDQDRHDDPGLRRFRRAAQRCFVARVHDEVVAGGTGTARAQSGARTWRARAWSAGLTYQAAVLVCMCDLPRVARSGCPGLATAVTLGYRADDCRRLHPEQLGDACEPPLVLGVGRSPLALNMLVTASNALRRSVHVVRQHASGSPQARPPGRAAA